VIVVQLILGKFWPWYRSTCCTTSVARTLAGLTVDLSDDFVPGCSQTMDSVGMTVQEVAVVVHSRGLLVQDALPYHEEKSENPNHGKGKFAWILPVHRD